MNVLIIGLSSEKDILLKKMIRKQELKVDVKNGREKKEGGGV